MSSTADVDGASIDLSALDGATLEMGEAGVQGPPPGGAKRRLEPVNASAEMTKKQMLEAKKAANGKSGAAVKEPYTWCVQGLP